MTRDGLNGLRVESQRGEISRVSPGQHSDPPNALYNVYRLFAEVKVAGMWS